MAHQSGLVRFLPTATILIFFVLLPAIILYSSRTLRGGAELFPIAMSVLMLAFMLCRTVRRSMGKQSRAGIAEGAAISGTKLACCAVILSLFIPLAGHVGFYAASFVFILIGYIAFSSRLSVRDAAYAFVTASVFTMGTHKIFYDILHILTPTGSLW
jgi:hypothetical protein